MNLIELGPFTIVHPFPGVFIVLFLLVGVGAVVFAIGKTIWSGFHETAEIFSYSQNQDEFYATQLQEITVPEGRAWFGRVDPDGEQWEEKQDRVTCFYCGMDSDAELNQCPHCGGNLRRK